MSAWAPVPGWKPRAQGTQPVLMALGMKPGLQAVHTVEPASRDTRPTPHGTHVPSTAW